MKPVWNKYRALIIVLAVAIAVISLILVITGRNNDNTDDGSTEPITSATYMAKDSYQIHKAADGTWSVHVRDCMGTAILGRDNLPYQPTVTIINDAVVCVVGQSAPGLSRTWAVYCDVRSGVVSQMFGGYMAHNRNYVAYLANLTDAWHVFVQDGFNDRVYQEATTLTGAVPNQNNEVIKSYEVNAEGDLSVEYYTGEDTTQTIIIDMP